MTMVTDGSYYGIKMQDWRYLKSLDVYGSKQDLFVTAAGYLITVSKDYPLKGWHVSIGAPGGPPSEMLEREVQRFFEQQEATYMRAMVSPLTGRINYMEVL